MIKADFVESMNRSSSKINNDSKWLLLKHLYDQNYVPHPGTQKIPKILHQIWLGGSLPPIYKRLHDIWRYYHPDWELKIWTDEDVDKLNLVNKDIFNSLDNLGIKSDILRYEILYRYGGLYTDTDFEFVRSFNDLTYLNFFSGSGQVAEPTIFNGLIGSAPSYNLLKILIENIHQKADATRKYNSSDFDKMMHLTGPYFFTETFFNNIDKNTKNVVVFPTTYFYCFPAICRFEIRNDDVERSKNIIHSFKSEESYAIHLWYTSWQK